MRNITNNISSTVDTWPYSMEEDIRIAEGFDPIFKNISTPSYISTPSFIATHNIATSTPPKKQRGIWSVEQDDALRIAVEKHEGKNWKAIAKEVPGNRTHIQCLQRWNKVLKPGLVKGSWTPEEDELLKKYVPLEPAGNWVAVAQHISGRTAKQCRERWSLCLDPNIKRDPWTEEEDELLRRLQEQYGSKWVQIAHQLPGRTENAVKSRFKSLGRLKKREWTKEEDEVILQGKSEQLSWEKIVQLLPKTNSKRTKHSIKARWRELGGFSMENANHKYNN